MFIQLHDPSLPLSPGRTVCTCIQRMARTTGSLFGALFFQPLVFSHGFDILSWIVWKNQVKTGCVPKSWDLVLTNFSNTTFSHPIQCQDLPTKDSCVDNSVTQEASDPERCINGFCLLGFFGHCGWESHVMCARGVVVRIRNWCIWNAFFKFICFWSFLRSSIAREKRRRRCRPKTKKGV